jgi:predicted metal-binding membrane protein
VSSAPDQTSRLLRHERRIVAAGIALLVALCAWYLAAGAGMDGEMAMEPPLPALIMMWWVMMAAMMLPSAAPAILLYARVRAMRSGDGAVAATWVFLSGYLAVWLLFSVVAAAAQQWLTGPSMALGSRALSAAVLIAAGAYQLSPLKGVCLRQCRTPAQFISRHWRPGSSGAARLGLLHGAYCVGCCWMLMALLFVAGIMNFAWITAFAAIVAVEKLLPRGEWIARATGVVLIAWGVARIAG